MKRIASLAFALLGSATIAAQAQEPVEITFFIWAGSNQGVVPTEIINAYKEKHPGVVINILESNNTITYPKMIAARRTTPDDPLVHCGYFNANTMAKGDVDDMWESIDPALVPNLNNVFDNFRRADNKGIGFEMDGIGILYNKDKVQQPPDSWNVLWSPSSKGRVTMFDYDTQMLAMAARLNGGDETNIDPGFKAWADNAENIRALVDSNDGLKNLLVSGDAWFAPWYASIASVWIEEGAPLGFVVPKEGAVAFPVYLAIAKGVDEGQRKVCSELINTLLEPANVGKDSQLTNSIPVVKGVELTEEQKNSPTFDPTMAERAIVLDYGQIGKMSADWRQRWDREVKINMR